jgi:hypothetical protein
MRFSRVFTRLAVVLAAGLWIAGPAAGGEKTMMHCFTFTVIEEATEADWKAFRNATDELPSKIPGLLRVWHGRLRSPQNLIATDGETGKRLRAGETNVTGPVRRVLRQHGVCMEMEGEATLKTYAGHPAHTAWMSHYTKVRVPGTTTFDLIGQ